MRSLGKGVMSATTQVKVLSPEMLLVALGQGFHFMEASIAADVSVHHCIVSLHSGIVSLHRGFVSLQCVFARIYRDIAALH